MSRKILLLGGGYVISRLASELPKEEFVVTARSKEKKEQFESLGYQVSIVDISNKSEVSELFKNHSFTHIIDSIPPLYKAADPTVGIKNIVGEILRSKSQPCAFYLSTTGVYGKNEGEEVSESTVCTPQNERAIARLESERIYSECNNTFTAFRLSGIYGPGRGIGVSLRERKYTLLEDGTRYTNRIHVDDIVAVLKKAMSLHSNTLPSVLNLNDNEPAPMRDVVDFYVKNFQLEPPQSITKSEAQKLGRSRLLTLNQKVSNALLRAKLYSDFIYPTFREGAGTEF